MHMIVLSETVLMRVLFYENGEVIIVLVTALSENFLRKLS